MDRKPRERIARAAAIAEESIVRAIEHPKRDETNCCGCEKDAPPDGAERTRDDRISNDDAGPVRPSQVEVLMKSLSYRWK